MGAIVVGVDGSPEALAALRWAVEEGRLRHAKVRSVLVWQPPIVDGYPYTGGAFDPQRMEAGARAMLRDAVDQVVEATSESRPDEVVVCGSPAEALLECSHDAEMLVVGSRGRGGFAGLVLGSVSQQVAHHATCPVVIVRP